MEYKKIEFPQDELKHDTVGEWWYFNGNLLGDDGKRYSYMNTLFRAAIPTLVGKRKEDKTLRNAYFYHAILTDVCNNKFYPHIDHISILSKDSFTSPLLNVYFTKPYGILKYSCYYIEEPKKFEYRLKGDAFALEMKSRKEPLLEGGNGFVTNLGKSTYYYSLTNMVTSGTINVGGKSIGVTGKSWMDHQWSNALPQKDYWNWFSIQLDNDVEIVCYEYGNWEESNYLATFIYKDGKQKTFEKVKISPVGMEWKSKVTRSTYPLRWKIEIIDAEVELIIESAVEDHEMNFLNINYWESPTIIKGTVSKKPVTGRGYMELAGRPSIFNDIGFLKDKLKNKVLKRS